MLSLYRAAYPLAESDDLQVSASSLRVALALATVAVGLRGIVASLWGYAIASGASRMPEQLNLPMGWGTPDMTRLDPQADYTAMRNRLFDGDWSELSKASPWQWMLALIGLLDAGFAHAFNSAPLKRIYLILSAWQTDSASVDDVNQSNDLEPRWPFDALPNFMLEQCEGLIRDLPEALCSIDQERGMRLDMRSVSYVWPQSAH